jgi:hypothetical protein
MSELDLFLRSEANVAIYFKIKNKGILFLAFSATFHHFQWPDYQNFVINPIPRARLTMGFKDCANIAFNRFSVSPDLVI